jgi:hypothetical protein
MIQMVQNGMLCAYFTFCTLTASIRVLQPDPSSECYLSNRSKLMVLPSICFAWVSTIGHCPEPWGNLVLISLADCCVVGFCHRQRYFTANTLTLYILFSISLLYLARLWFLGSWFGIWSFRPVWKGDNLSNFVYFLSRSLPAIC